MNHHRPDRLLTMLEPVKQTTMKPTPDTLEVYANVRYWEDAIINGQEAPEDGKGVPCKHGDTWAVSIDLDSGRVHDWPQGTTADIHFKVCDEGKYYLLVENEERYRWKGHYVPDAWLCPQESGYGDYIIMKINAEGFIEGWKRPAFDADEWEEI